MVIKFAQRVRVSVLTQLPGDIEGEEQEVLDDLECDEQEDIEATFKDKEEFNFLSNLANSLPDVSSEEEDPMEGDPRSLVSQRLMKDLLNPHGGSEEVGEVAEVEHSVQEGNCGSGDLDTTPFCAPCDGNVCYCEDRRQTTCFTT